MGYVKEEYKIQIQANNHKLIAPAFENTVNWPPAQYFSRCTRPDHLFRHKKETLKKWFFFMRTFQQLHIFPFIYNSKLLHKDLNNNEMNDKPLFGSDEIKWLKSENRRGDLLLVIVVVEWKRIRKSAPSGASGTNSPRHGTFKPLRQLMLLKCHRKCLKMQFFLTYQLPLWSTHWSLASRSNIFALLLCHAYETITHFLFFKGKGSPRLIFVPALLCCVCLLSELLSWL